MSQNIIKLIVDLLWLATKVFSYTGGIMIHKSKLLIKIAG